MLLLTEDGAKPLPPGQSGVSRLKALKVPHGNAQRALSTDQDMNLGTMDQLAVALKVSPWELLIPWKSVKARPRISQDVPPRTLFSAQLMERLTALSSDEIWKIENKLRLDQDMDLLPRPPNAKAA